MDRVTLLVRSSQSSVYAACEEPERINAILHLLRWNFPAHHGGRISDTLQQIETQLLMRQYDGLMKTGRSREGKPLLPPNFNMIQVKTSAEVELMRESALLVSAALTGS